MGNYIAEKNGVSIFSCDYDNYRNKEQINSLMAEGACFRLSKFIQTLGLEETAEDVYNNTSAIRDGNRIDILDNYIFDEEEGLEITFMYIVNNTCWAVIYDTYAGKYYGEFELT